MGVTLGIHTSTGQDIPFGFSRTDSKEFFRYLESENAVDKIAQHFSIDIAPLHRIASREEEPLESFMARDPTESRRQFWLKEHAAAEAAWQTPQNLLQVLEALRHALPTDPEMYKQLGLVEPYFLEGYFRSDVEDLYRMVEWTERLGIEKIRLEAGS